MKKRVFTDGVVTATFDKTAGTLTFSGEGAVWNIDDWVKLGNKEKPFVKELIFEDGIKSIGEHEFSNVLNDGFPNLSVVTFKGNINEIGSFNFSHIPNLTKVEFFGKCKKINSNAFYDCVTLDDVIIPADCNVASSAFDETPVEGKFKSDDVSTNDNIFRETPPDENVPHGMSSDERWDLPV